MTAKIKKIDSRLKNPFMLLYKMEWIEKNASGHIIYRNKVIWREAKMLGKINQSAR